MPDICYNIIWEGSVWAVLMKQNWPRVDNYSTFAYFEFFHNKKKFLSHYEVCTTTIIPLLQMRKLRNREVK